MQIAVCDDVQKELEIIRAALDTYRKAHPQYHFDIDEYRAAMDVIHAVEKGKMYDIALLDICMPGILGTEAAEEMLVKSPDMGVIFLTTSDEYAVEAFAMNATHYLLKPFSQEQFDAALDRAIKKSEDQDLLSLVCVDGAYRVRISEIVFVETQNHYLILSLFSGEKLRVRMKLSQMFEEVQTHPEFIRVGASYVINLMFARSISENSIKMQDGMKIPIPRRSSEEVRKAYMDFCRKEAKK